MTSPRPLIDTSDNQLTRSLLQAGREDLAAVEFGQRLLLGLGVAGAVTSMSVAAAGSAGAAVHGVAAGGSGATSLALVAAKWVAVGVLGGGILAGTAELVFTPRASAPIVTRAVPPPPEVPRPTPARAQPLTLPVETLAPSATPLQPAPTLVKVPDVAPSAGPGGQPGQLGREVRAIDHARQLLASGNFSQALLELDAFDRTANTGVLDREARVLRIETLYKLGFALRASALTEQYVGLYPNDAHVAQLRALGQGTSHQGGGK